MWSAYLPAFHMWSDGNILAGEKQCADFPTEMSPVNKVGNPNGSITFFTSINKSTKELFFFIVLNWNFCIKMFLVAHSWKALLQQPRVCEFLSLITL